MSLDIFTGCHIFCTLHKVWQLPQVGETGKKEQTESLRGKKQTQTELHGPENIKTKVVFDYIFLPFCSSAFDYFPMLLSFENILVTSAKELDL